MARALSAAPPNIAKAGKVVDLDDKGNSGTPIKEPPHCLIMWPVDPKTTGLSVEPKQTGTWIMWAGTPYSRLVIKEHPNDGPFGI